MKIVQNGKIVDEVGQAVLLVITVVLLATWNWKQYSHEGIHEKKEYIS